MGKKSKNPRKAPAKAAAGSPHRNGSTPAAPMELTYPSDGPSNEEMDCLQTSCESLQAKLDQLTALAMANDRAGFVSQFVPLDLSLPDRDSYLVDLTSAPEAEGQWINLASEIATLAAGKGVTKIEGDQETRAVFFFEHPLLPGCDREVTFVCDPTTKEWRAEG